MKFIGTTIGMRFFLLVYLPKNQKYIFLIITSTFQKTHLASVAAIGFSTYTDDHF